MLALRIVGYGDTTTISKAKARLTSCSEDKLSISTALGSISTLSVDTDQFEMTSIDLTWHRLIPSRFPPIRVYERIAANDSHDAITSLEILTSPRVRARKRLIGIGAVDEASPQIQNWNHAPFTYQNPEGSTLFKPTIGVLELFDTLQTALAVSVQRRERFLRSTGMPKMGLDMRVLKTRVAGNFVDLRGTALPEERQARWILGDKFYEANIDGVLFDCPARSGSTCLSLLNGSLLNRTMQADHFRFIWNGEIISSLYSFSGEGKIISPEDLAGPAISALE